jgi:hypothetical protein
LTHIKKLNPEVLEVTKLSKVLAAFAKRGNDEVKVLVKLVIENAGSTGARNEVGSTNVTSTVSGTTSKVAKANDLNSKAVEESKKVLGETKASASRIAVKSGEIKPKSEPQASEGVAGTKRARSGAEVLAAPAAKRTAVSTTATSKTATPNTSTAVKKPLSTLGSKSSANVSSSATASKSKTVTSAAAKPSGFFSSVQTTVKKPQGTAVEKKTSTNPSAATTSTPSGSGFSLGGLLEGLTNAKSIETKSKASEPKVVETEEEKAKRLRKEARRKLRVSWKVGDELVEVRLFTHDPEEDTGHDASSVRDAGDIMNEGRAFKEGLKHQVPLIDEAGDDDELSEQVIVENFGDEDFRWSEVDAEEIEAADREKNYARFLGPQQPISPERDRQQERDMSTLMALYMKRSDIPSDPREPINPYAGRLLQTVDFGKPGDRTVSRLEKLLPYSIPSQTAPSIDIAAILSSLTPQTMPQPSQSAASQVHPPAAASQGQGSWLETIFAQHSAPATTQLQQPIPPAPSYTYTPPPATTSTDAILAALQGYSSAHATAQQPQPPAQPQAQALDFNSLLVQLTAHNQPTPPQPQPYAPPPAITPDTANLLATLGLAQPNYAAYNVPPQQQSQPTPAAQSDSHYSAPYEHPDRKRFREGSEDDERDDFKRANINGGAGRGGGSTGYSNKFDRNAKPKWLNKTVVDEAKKFTQPCKFWPEGKCRKGADCTYRHDPL